MIPMRFDSAERFYGGQTGLKPHISNEIAYVESPMWNSLTTGLAPSKLSRGCQKLTNIQVFPQSSSL